MFYKSPRTFIFLSLALAPLLLLGDWAGGQPGKPEIIRIGSSNTITGATQGAKETAAVKTLQAFIKEETGLANEIERIKHWRDLAAKLAKGELEIGVLQGYEFAWAQEKFPDIKPLALAVNVFLYPVAFIVEHKDTAGQGFASLKGKSLTLVPEPTFVRLFIDRQAQTANAKADGFFSKIHKADNIEDAIDDVVDKKVQAAAIDRAALEAYKRRKPGRFNQLKSVVNSDPFPPAAVVYFEGKLDRSILDRFRDGLLNANKKEKGETMLNLFRLTRFDPIPVDLSKILTQTRKEYAAELGDKK